MSKKSHKNIIGVFDSGLGGLSIFKYFLKDLPNYNYTYLGDNARVPYGDKSPETIYNYTKEAVEFLFQQGCGLIIIACNTASTQALRRLQQEYLPNKYPLRKILGVIRPLVEEVSKTVGPIGVIGTKATINSHAYLLEINKLNPDVKIYQQAAPLLVPLIEEGWMKKPETKMILKKYLHPLKTKQIKSLILACTHYPFLYKEIKQIMGKQIVVPNPGDIVVNKLKDYLERHPELAIQPVPQPKLDFQTTDNAETFKKMAEKFLGQRIDKVTKVKITDL